MHIQKTVRAFVRWTLGALFRTFLRLSAWSGNGRTVSAFVPDSILVVETSALGDVLLSTPALRALRGLYPNARVSMALDNHYGELLHGNRNVSSTYLLEASDSLTGFFRAVKRVRSETFDLAMNFSPTIRNALLVWLAKAPRKIGYFERLYSYEGLNHSIQVTGIGISVAKTFSYHGQHLVDRALDVVRALEHSIGQSPGTLTEISQMSAAWDPPLLDLHIPNELRSEAQRRYLSAGARRNLIVIHPVAGWPFRTWSPDRFRDLLARLWAMREVRIVLIGGDKDRAVLDWIASGAGGDVEIIVGKSLLEVAALIDSADVFIGADSGPMHIASSVGTPCVAMFGPSTPRESGPIGPGHRVLYSHVECSPCMQTVCVRPESPCINLITLEEVASAAIGIVSEERGRSSRRNLNHLGTSLSVGGDPGGN